MPWLFYGIILSVLGAYGQLTISTLNIWLLNSHNGVHIGILLTGSMTAQVIASVLQRTTTHNARRTLFLTTGTMCISAVLLVVAAETQIISLFYAAQCMSAFAGAIAFNAGTILLREALGKNQHRGHTISVFANTALNAITYFLSLNYLTLVEGAWVTLGILGFLWVVVSIYPRKREWGNLERSSTRFQQGKVKKSKYTVQQFLRDPGFWWAIGNVGSISAAFALPIILPLAYQNAGTIMLIVGIGGGALVMLCAIWLKLDLHPQLVQLLITVSRGCQLIGILLLGLGSDSWITMVCLAVGQANWSLSATVTYKKSKTNGVLADSIVTNSGGLAGNIIGITFGNLLGFQESLIVFVPLIAFSFLFSIRALFRA